MASLYSVLRPALLCVPSWRVAALFAGLVVSVLPLSAQLTLDWGGGNGSWNTAANWAPRALPATTDTARNSAGTASVDTNVSVAALVLSGGSVSGNATLTLTGSGSTWSAGSLNSNGGTLALASGATLAITTGNDHDFNARTITNSGTITWSEGHLRSGNGGAIVNAPGATFNATANGYSFYVPSGYGGSAVFTNQGTFNRSGAGDTPIDVPFNNSGFINVTAGSLSLRAGGTSSGVITVSGTGSSLLLTNGYTLTTGSTLNGPVRATGGTLTATGNITLSQLSLEGGSLAGTQTFLGGTIDWTGGNWNAGAADVTTLASGVTLNIATGNDHDFNARSILNQGTVNWTAGHLRAGNGSVFTNAAGATFNDLNASSYIIHAPSGFGGSFSFENLGTYRRNAGGTTSFDVPFNNSGAIDLQQGGLTFRGGGSFTSNGTMLAASGTSVSFESNFTLTSGASLTGSGTYSLNSGTLTIPTGTLNLSTFNQNGGVLAGSPTLSGTYTWNNGHWNAAGATTTIASGATLNIATGNDHDFNARSILNQGTVNWTAGHLRAGNGSTFTNAVGATFNDLNASSYIIHAPSGFGGSFSFENLGTYRRNATGTTNFDVPFNNSGTIDLQQGALAFRAGGSFTATGTLLAATGTAVSFESNFTLTSGASLTGTGTYSLNSGTLTIPTGTLNLSTFNQNGGVLAGSPTLSGTYNWNNGHWNAAGATTTIASGATLNLATGADHDFNARSILNQGTVNWTAGHLRAGNGSVFTNAAGATFNDLNASSYTIHAPSGYGGSFSFVNAGTYVRNTTGTTYFDVPFTNSGTLSLLQGNLEFRGGGTLDAKGTVSAATGTNVFFRNNYTVTSGASLTGSGDYWLTGGTLTLTGTLAASRITQTDGVLGGLTNALAGLYNWNGGNWNSSAGATTTVLSGATLNIATGNDHDFNARSILNQGTVNWTAGHLRAGNGSVFTNAAGATFNDLNASSYSIHAPSGYGGSFSFENLGLYRRNAGGTTYFDVPFNNSGTIDLAQGNLEFRGGGTMTSSGSIAAAANTQVYFRNDYTLANGASLTGAGAYALTGGTLTLSGTVGVGSFTQHGGTLAGTHAFTGNFTWNGGSWNGSTGNLTTIASGGTLQIATGNDHDFNARSILNQGTVTWTAGHLRGGNGSVFTNATGATFNDLNASGYSFHVPSGYGGSGSFVNAGTYVRNTTGATYFDVPFTNSGTLSLLGNGEIQLRAGGTMTGTSVATVAAGSRLLFISDYTLLDGAQFTGSGTFHHASATLSINGALRASSFLWSGGNWNAATNSGLTTTIAPGTVLTLTHDNDGTRDFYGRAVVNQGTVNWSSAYLRSGGGGSFTNASGGIFNDTQTSGYTIHNPSNFGGTFSLTNNGTYNRNASGTTYLDIPFFNNATLNLLQGDLQLRAGGTMSATSIVNAGTGTRLYFVSDYRLATGSQFTGPGLINQVGGTLTIDGTLTAAAFLWSGGNWNAATDSGLTTTLAASTTLNLTHDSDATRDFYGRAVVNQGTVNWSSAYLRSGGGGSFTNASGGIFNDTQTSGYTIHNPSNFGGAFAFTNNGTYNRNASGTTYLDVPFFNNAALNLLQGDLQLRAGGTMSATSVVNAASGTHLYFLSDYRLVTGARFTGPGLVNQVAGTLTIDGTLTASSFVWSGGNWNAATSSGLTTLIASGSTLNLTHDHDATRDFYGRAVVNQGTVNWLSAYLRSGGGGSFTNASGGTFNDLNSSGYSVHNPSGFGGTFTFTNEGTYLKSTGGTTTFDIPFTNTGLLSISAGNLVFNSTFTNTGAGTVIAAGGNVSFATPLNLGTGKLGGTGTITAPSVTAGGPVAPGNSPGQLTLTGDLTLLTTSTLLIELAGPAKGTSYDFLSIGGNAALAGNLSVSFLSGFQASVAPTDTFTVVTATNLTGAFANIANGQRLFTSDGLGSFQVNYGPASTFALNSVVLTNFVPIPEPSTYALLALGLLALAVAHRRRK